jgi:hypothetical protein
MKPTGKRFEPLTDLPVLILSLLVVFVYTSAAVAQSPATFTPTGKMTTPRPGHTATLLLDGRVLITGGVANERLGTGLSSAEVYQPLTGTFTPTGDMTMPRAGHTATLLPDGRVLIAGGGTNGLNGPTASAELYDPSTGTFTRTGDMIAAHSFHQATLLGNGKVLISGGYGGQWYVVPSAELYDPTTGTFSAIGPYTSNTSGFNSFQGASSTLLPDGKVLIVWEEMASEVYDPDTGMFSPTGHTSAPSYNDDLPTTTLLMSGEVLVAGGADDEGFYAKAELYDRSTGTFGAAGNMVTGRSEHTATLLPDGTVLLAGGLGSFGPQPPGLTSAEIYDPASSTFSVTGTTTVVRGHTATLLNNGRVLLAGVGSPGTTTNAELYSPTVLVPAPAFISLSGDSNGQGAILHAGIDQIVSPDNPAIAGDVLEIHCTGLADGSVIPPQVTIGGRMAQILSFGPAPGSSGGNQVTVRVPSGIAPGQTVPVRLSYIGRTSNEVTIVVGALVVIDLRFDQSSVAAGASYTVHVAGSYLTPETFFDVRFSSPGSNSNNVVLNWQKGLAASHQVPVGAAQGSWAINGVRAHQDEADHTGDFVPVLATITVSP